MLTYLSRYTHRVAISNGRLIAMDEHGVTFKWKDYRVKNGSKGRTRHKTMKLEPGEFMRRFLLHVLPGAFHRIRHDGYWPMADARRSWIWRAGCCASRLSRSRQPTVVSSRSSSPRSCAGNVARR